MKLGFDLYASVGLTQNPFTPHALRPDKQGKRLLIGREDEVELVANRLHKNGKITCLDGHVGVGKTSLVNVAAYECFEAYLKGDTPQLLIPSIVGYQLKPKGNIDQFCTEVFQGVAQTLIRYHQYLSEYDTKGISLPQVNAWLNSPIVEHMNKTENLGFRFSAGIASVSGNAGESPSKQVNQSTGFSQSGFETLVKDLLNEIFTVQGNGGVVCVIDNIELLENGEDARKMLEALRDKLFNVNGLRWVFCGANGVIHSLAASPRLTAFLNTPVINVANVKVSAIVPLIRARLQEYSTAPEEVERELPVALEDLELLYRIVNSNLRDLLALADEFCEFSAQSGRPLRVNSTRKEKFQRWLEKATAERYDSLSSRISQNAWVVLDVAMSRLFQGTFGAADYSSFNQNSTVSFVETTFKKWLSQLMKLGLITKELDDGRDTQEDGENETDGFSRDVFSVTAKGALVHYARRKRRENLSVADDPDWMRPIHHVDTSVPRKTIR